MYKGSDGQPGSEYIDFSYNADGLRVGKQRLYYDANGVAHFENTSYTLHGKNIVHLVHEGNNLHFWYDASGKPALVEYNGVKYGYLQNLQGDIVGIIDSLGNEVVKYAYDAWGKPLSCTGTMAASLGKLNPFRYRGYVFDEETGLYYLRSRYYCSNLVRFVNSDCFFTSNLFAYCNNNCIMLHDPTGCYSEDDYYAGFPTHAKAGMPTLYNVVTDNINETTYVDFNSPITSKTKYIIPGSYIWGRRLRENPNYLYCLVNVHNTETGQDTIECGAIAVQNTDKNLENILYSQKIFQLYSSSLEAELFSEHINRYMEHYNIDDGIAYGNGLTNKAIATIMNFQRMNNLYPDGKAGPATQKVLVEFLKENVFPYNRESAIQFKK